jgi:hypothetical protein
VSKREVFNVFCKFGRIAQVSQKNAYGFVQYHRPEDAERAIKATNGLDMKGRIISKYLYPTQPVPCGRGLVTDHVDRRNQMQVPRQPEEAG